MKLKQRKRMKSRKCQRSVLTSVVLPMRDLVVASADLVVALEKAMAVSADLAVALEKEPADLVDLVVHLQEKAFQENRVRQEAVLVRL